MTRGRKQKSRSGARSYPWSMSGAGPRIKSWSGAWSMSGSGSGAVRRSGSLAASSLEAWSRPGSGSGSGSWSRSHMSGFRSG